MQRDIPLCILVVEDDPSVSDMLESAFRTWGYGVWIARNGQEGLDIIRTQTVDGILLDMHMPIMDGRTMLDELRWMGSQVPVWVMSGGMDRHALQQFLQEGAQGFFVKPFRLESLQQTCTQVFRRMTHRKKRLDSSPSVKKSHGESHAYANNSNR